MDDVSKADLVSSILSGRLGSVGGLAVLSILSALPVRPSLFLSAPDLYHPQHMGMQMNPNSREIYVSSNGDRWLLVMEGERSLVRHLPNPASGGPPQDTDVDAFLLANRNSPQGQTLQNMREQH